MRGLVWLSLIFCTSLASANSIWHITGEKEFYLYGTIHVLKASAYPLPSAYNETFSHCDDLWLEADLNAMADPEVVSQLQALMALPQGQTLKNVMSEQAYQQLELLAAEANTPLAVFQAHKPWVVANALTVAIFQQRGFVVDKGLDQHLQNKANASGIPVNFFETIMWQLEMFDDMAADYADEFIEFSVNDIDKVDELVDGMFSSWRSGDTNALYSQADFEKYRPIEKILLTNRNNTWMEKLLKTQDGVHCVAVGALHMAADHGLLSQFKQAGYRVEKIN